MLNDLMRSTQAPLDPGEGEATGRNSSAMRSSWDELHENDGGLCSSMLAPSNGDESIM